MESLCMRHLIYRTVKGVDDSRRKWLRYIPNSQSNDGSVRICLGICGYLFCDSRKEIASWKFQIIFINFKRILSPSLYFFNVLNSRRVYHNTFPETRKENFQKA